MEKIFIASDNDDLFDYLNNSSKYSEYFKNVQFVKTTSATSITERNSCVIIDKENYELDILRLFAKKMYVLLCTDKKELDIDIERDNRIMILDRPYSLEQIYCALKSMLDYKNMETEFNKNKDSETDVRHAAETDYLTGLPNRRGMYEYFDIALKSDTVHCMFIDIDNFKKINDTYGHKMGDKLLIKVSQLIKKKVGDAFFARLSGDEFAVIMDGGESKEQVIKIAESIINSVEEIHMSVDVSSVISFSIGVMLDQASSDDLDDILMRCDAAMYKAKRSGKGRYVIYNDIESQVLYKMSVDRDKYNALANEQFKIYMQPVMNIGTSGVENIEAGIYWEHPKDGLRKPSDFLYILEEDGFIVELELKMFEELCKELAEWKGSAVDGAQVLMRFSTKNLFSTKFIPRLLATLNIYSFKPERFCICFDEFESHPKSLAKLRELKKTGFEVACSKSIGDGKNTLLNVNDSIADVWIIEESLIKGMCESRTNLVVARSIISLAKQLNIKVIARGIENNEEAASLATYGCDIGIGVLYTKPLKPAGLYDFAINNMVLKHNTFDYSFDGNLRDQNGQNEGRFIGEKPLEYIFSQELGKNVLEFIGPNKVVLENTVEFPPEIINAKNYSFSVCMKMTERELWKAISYVQFENGFSGIMPFAWDGVVMFRVKDVIFEKDEWHDAIGNQLKENKWYYITATYNGKKQESRLYVDGKLLAICGEVHVLDKPQRVAVGGDVYQGAFKGQVSEVVIHDYVISSDEVMEEYKKYLGDIINSAE